VLLKCPEILKLFIVLHDKMVLNFSGLGRLINSILAEIFCKDTIE